MKNIMRKKGFTLIELLVVIAVIGLISSIVLVAFGPARKKARDAKGQSELNEIIKAIELKYSDNAVYPDLPDTATAIASGDTSLSPYLSPTPYIPMVKEFIFGMMEEQIRNSVFIFKERLMEYISPVVIKGAAKLILPMPALTFN